MKGLRWYLVLVYVALIILLLLTRWCCNRSTVPVVEPEEPLPPVTESFEADIVMLIDISGSMDAIINTVKDNARNFYPDIVRESRKQGKEITSMNIRVIGFRDSYDEVWCEPSPFYSFPSQEKGFNKFVSGLKPFGGGDTPEMGLDAIAYALGSSDWPDKGHAKTVLILWTDAPTHPIKNHVSADMVDVRSLAAKWNRDFASNGRIFLFAPDDSTWREVETEFHNTVRHDVVSGGGLSDLDYGEILKTISEDI